MIPGDSITFVGGNFVGMTGTFVRLEGDDLIVNIEVFGRQTELRVTHADIADPKADMREDWREEIRAGFDRWKWHLEQQWWQACCEREREPGAQQWRDLEAFRDGAMLSELAQEREALLAAFDAEFNDAAFEREGPAGLKRRFEDSVDTWLAYARRYKAVLAARRERLSNDDIYREALSEMNLRVHQRRHDSYRLAFCERENIGDGAERRQRALEAAMARYAEIKPRFQAIFGLKLPEQTAHFWAFWTSLEGAEKKAAKFVWRFPAGIMDWFKEAFDDWTLLDRLDHRLHYRYALAPPEFVCVMVGDSDGLNYGLWFDDPDKKPEWVASFYARADATVGVCGHTILEAYRQELERAYESIRGDPGLDEDAILEYYCQLDVLGEALGFFETAGRPEPGAEYENKYRVDYGGPDLVETVDGMGVQAKVPVELPARPESAWDIYQTYKNEPEIVQTWVDAARRELGEGNPYPALVVGRDLHRMRLESFDAAALELMTAAYQALGHDALAEIAKVHHQHRDLRSVDVYGKP